MMWALAYLAGVWTRHHQDKSFVFTAGPANGQRQAERVAALLNNLGCTGISIEHTVGLIPGGWIVYFTPTAEVSEWLHRTW